MKQWLKRIRGTIGMALTWGVGWALVGILIGVTSIVLPWLPWDAFFEVFDAPLPALGVPGFFGGAFFSLVLGIAGRNRRFDELSLPRFAAWGAVGGVLLSLFPGALVAVGLATPREGLNMWLSTAVIAGPLILMSTVSATVTLLVARRAQGRRALGGGVDVGEEELVGDETRELPAGDAWAFQGVRTGDAVDRARPGPASGSGDA